MQANKLWKDELVELCTSSIKLHASFRGAIIGSVITIKVS